MSNRPQTFCHVSTARSALAADGGHAAGGLDEALLADVVLELLGPHGIADDPFELNVVSTVSDRGAQVGFVQREQAGAKPSVGGQANPVTVAAERLGDRVDEADPSGAVLEAIDAGGGMGLARLGLERIDRVDHGA